MRKVWKSAVVLGLALVASQLAAAATGATNGALLAFTSLRGGNAALYVSNRDGGGAHRLTPAGVGAYQGDVAWAPDGSRVVFTCGNFELCVASSDGSGAARLTKSTWPDGWSYDFEPAWSPDGSEIVFSRTRGGRSSGLWVIGADGNGLRRLVDNAGNEGSPEWSPDGSGSPTPRMRARGTISTSSTETVQTCSASRAGRPSKPTRTGRQTARRSPMRVARPVRSRARFG